MKEVGIHNFDELVIRAKTPVLVDFWATWCKPCSALSAVLDKLAKDYEPLIAFIKVDVEQYTTLASRFGVMSLPTLVMFKEGNPTHIIVGNVTEKHIQQILQEVQQ